MTKAKKILAVLMCLITLLGVCSIAAGCPYDDGPKMYDVSIKISCSTLIDGQWIKGQSTEWIFTPDNDELHIKYEYNRREHRYYVSGYSFPNHPYRRGKWYTPDPSGSNYFNYNLTDQTNNKEYLTSVCERGEYLLYVTTNDDTNLWNYRTIRLYISVT